MSNISHKLVVIRKKHKCFGCLRQFDVGTKIYKWADIYQEDFSHGYMCVACDAIMQSWDKEDYNDNNDGYPEGCVREFLHEHAPHKTPEDFVEKHLQKIYSIPATIF